MTSISRPVGVGADSRRLPQRVDWYLILATLLLIGAGLLSLYSEGITRDGDASFRKQVLNSLIGLVPFGIFTFVSPRFWQRNMQVLYILNLILLLCVLVVGKGAKGAVRWIDVGPIQFQPSELAKLLTVVTLSAFYAARQESIRKLSTFGLGFLHVLVPMILIKAQPHLGAALVVLVSWLAISIVANVPFRHIGIAVGALVILGGLVFSVPSLRSKVLAGYQEGRVFGLVATGGKDVKGRNYQTDRAEIAFGAGGVFGSGYLRGEQKAAHFIPEQYNDFIFTVVGEEGGLIGCTIVLAFFGFFFYRVWLVLLMATEPYYRMLAAGIFAVLAFHMVVNIGMVLQLLPVVGLWLPFLSYGGTAMWLCMASVGLLLNLRRRERPLLF